MIDFNPYEVEHINFMKKDRYIAFRKMTPAQRQADITANTTESHYIYLGAFKKPEIDPQKLYSADDLTESIFIQEVRINIELNDWLITNVFRKQNDHVLSRNFKFKYHYVNYQMAERRNLDEKTGLCNKLCVLLDKDYNILFCGLIDQESNSIDESEINFELRIFSFAYLLSKASDVEVALFDKINVTEYNDTVQIGTVSGAHLRNNNILIGAFILESMRYYFGDDPAQVEDLNRIVTTYIPSLETKTGRLILNKEIMPLEQTSWKLEIPYCFLYGNTIYCVYKQLPIVGSNQRSYKIYNIQANDDLELISELNFDRSMLLLISAAEESDTENFREGFKTEYGFYPKFGDSRFDFWASGSYFTKMLPVQLSNNAPYSLVIDYKLPDQADYDICSGSGDTLKGEMLKLGDLAQFVCFYEMWYLDVDNDGIIRAKSKAVLRDNIQPVQRGTDISIRPLRRLNMTRKTFDCIDILNMSKPGTDNIQKIYDSLYNLRLYDSPFEEVDSVTVEKTNPGDLVHYQGNGIFLAVECDQVYAPEGFRYSKNKMWRTSYE